LVIGAIGVSVAVDSVVQGGLAGTSDYSCNVAVIPLVGEITSFDPGVYEAVDFADYDMTSADMVIAKLHQAEANRDIEGVLVRIDSPGGGPVASEMIMNAIRRLDIPTVALIRETGASGGYLAATGADTIIASAYSDVGGIGITMSYLENSQQNTQNGLEYVQLSSGKYKDSYSPDKPLTSDERALAERDLAIWKRVFVGEVAENRRMSIEQVEKLADGSTLPGELALAAGLIDSIGDQNSAQAWFAKNLGVEEEKVVFCE
jgi:protease-4